MLTSAEAADGALYVLAVARGSDEGAVRDRDGRVVAFTDPETCQAVAHYLAADGYPPILAPVLVEAPTDARIVSTSEQALDVLHECLD